MFLKFPIRSILLGGAMVVAALGSASAENWYVLQLNRDGAILMDADSRKTAPRVTVDVRVVQPGIREVQKTPIIAAQFTFEFDCKANRLRTVEFSLIDLDGHAPAGFRLDKVRDWSAIKEKDIANLYKAFACDGRKPPKIVASYRKFTDLESRYLMWLDDPGAGDYAEWVTHLPTGR